MFWVVPVPPRWILEPTDKAFAQGSDAKVECKADGFPRPQVTWKRAAGELIIKTFSQRRYYVKMKNSVTYSQTATASEF